VSVPLQYVQSTDAKDSGWINFIVGGAWKGTVQTVDNQEASFSLYHVMRAFSQGTESITTTDLSGKINQESNGDAFSTPDSVKGILGVDYVDFYTPIDNIFPAFAFNDNMTTTPTNNSVTAGNFLVAMNFLRVSGDFYDLNREGEPSDIDYRKQRLQEGILLNQKFYVVSFDDKGLIKKIEVKEQDNVLIIEQFIFGVYQNTINGNDEGYGGVNLKILDMKIMRDGKGIPLPLHRQPPMIINNVHGMLHIITAVEIFDAPLYFGLNEKNITGIFTLMP